ncbi:MAG: tetratricopeptide repeat protein [Cuspidothrix sp.]
MKNRIFSVLLLALSLTTTPQLVFAQNSVEQLFQQGTAAETVGNNSQAETIWRKVIQLEPNNGKAYNNLGNALRRQGKLPEALAAHQKALQLNPNDAEAYVGIGNVLNAQGKQEEALASHYKAIQLNPNLAIAYNGLGNVLRTQKKLNEAITAFQKAIEIDPKYAFPYINLGLIFKEQRKIDESIAALKKSIQLNPNYAFVYNNLGIALSDQNKLEQAVAAYQKAIELDPKYATAYYNLGVALRQQKKLDEAIAAYQKAIELDPKYATAYNNLGNALYDQKKLDEAIAAYQKAIELDPKDATAYNNLGIALYNQKKLDEAISNYKTALSLPEDTSTTPTTAHTLANNGLGLVFQEQGKLKEARKHFDKAEELDPDFIYARNNNIEADRLWKEQQNKLASVEDDRQWLPKNDPTLPVKRSVVRITTQFFNSERQGTEVGTGVVIHRDANRTLIITNRHLIVDRNEQGKDIQVEFFSSPPPDRVRMRRNAKLLPMNPTDELDLAILEVTDKLPEDIQPLPMSATTINHSTPIKIIGHSARRGKDESWTIKQGKISSDNNKQLEMYQTNLEPGYSGSPVLDSENRLIGVVYARKKGETKNFAYPISVVKKQLSIWKITLTK